MAHRADSGYRWLGMSSRRFSWPVAYEQPISPQHFMNQSMRSIAEARLGFYFNSHPGNIFVPSLALTITVWLSDFDYNLSFRRSYKGQATVRPAWIT
jgi:hypothetical protein